MTVVFHEMVQSEFDAAVAHYSKIDARLGLSFVEQVERIVETPRAWPLIGAGLWRYRLPRFPFGLVYRLHANEIKIYAVMHLKRRPGYWRHRLKI